MARSNTLPVATLLVVLCALSSSSCTQNATMRSSNTDVEGGDTNARSDALPSGFEEPAELVLRQFDTKDVVFLGEPHKVQEHLRFMAQLVPALHARGVDFLFYEFMAHEDNAAIDSLLNAPRFDRQLAGRWLAGPLYDWAFAEYVDVLEAAWQVNRTAPPDHKFHVLGINNRTYWGKDRNQRWQERDWADVILQATEHGKRKALVYCGTHHALYKTTLPYFENGVVAGHAKRDRVSHYVLDDLGPARVSTIWLHYLWPDAGFRMQHVPHGGVFDSLACAMRRPFAFDANASPWGAHVDTGSVYAAGTAGMALKELVDGYIVLAPITDLHLCRYIPHFIAERDMALVNAQVLFFEGYTMSNAEQVNDTLDAYYSWLARQFEERRAFAPPCR